MKRPNTITAELKKSNVSLSEYVSQLEKENQRLHKEIAKMQVKDVSNQNQIEALKKGQPKVNIIMNMDGETKKMVF